MYFVLGDWGGGGGGGYYTFLISSSPMASGRLYLTFVVEWPAYLHIFNPLMPSVPQNAASDQSLHCLHDIQEFS